MIARLVSVPGLAQFPTTTNFVLVKLPHESSDPQPRDYLVAVYGVYLRECGNKLGLSGRYVRLTVRPGADVDRRIDRLLGYASNNPRREISARPG